MLYVKIGEHYCELPWGVGGGGGGAGSQQRSLLSKYATVMLLLLDAMPSFYYVMCGVFAIMPA